MQLNLPTLTRRRYLPALVALVALSAAAVLVTVEGTTKAGDAAGDCLVTPGEAPLIPQVTADPRSPAGLRQYAAAERTFWGFDASATAIRRAADDPEATTDDLGTPLTPEEASTFATFEAVAASITTVDMTGEKRENYAGTYVDPANPHVLDVVIANEDCGLLENLRNASPHEVLHGVPAAHNLDSATLYATAARFNAKIHELDSEGVEITLAGVSIPSNTFHVQLLPESPTNSEALIHQAVGSMGVSVTRDGVVQVAG